MQVELGAEVSESQETDPLIEEIETFLNDAARLARRQQLRAEDIASLRLQMGSTFVWRLDFAEVFRRKSGFDIAIANPPYVRQEAITEIKPQLRLTFPRTYSGVADIYVYFYDRALSVLRASGVLCFISSNKYFKARYGNRLRRLLTTEATLSTIVDFADLPVFDATTYPAVVIARHQAPGEDAGVRTLTMESLANLDELTSIISEHGVNVPIRLLSHDGWVLEDPALHSLLEKVRANGGPLGDFVAGQLFRGIVTGYNNAFLVDARTRENLIREDESSAEIIKPFVRGRSVKRWRVDAGDLWLIFTRRGIEIDDYPAVKRHLSAFRQRLEPGQAGGRKPGEYAWYEIQDVIDYHEAFESPKIIFPHNATSPNYAFDTTGLLCNDKAYIVPTRERWLVGILNSIVSEFEMSLMSPPLRGGYYEHRVIYVSRLTIPRVDERTKVRLDELVSAGEADRLNQDELDELVVGAFGLTPGDMELMRIHLRKQERKDLKALRGVLATRGGPAIDSEE